MKSCTFRVGRSARGAAPFTGLVQKSILVATVNRTCKYARKRQTHRGSCGDSSRGGHTRSGATRALVVLAFLLPSLLPSRTRDRLAFIYIRCCKYPIFGNPIYVRMYVCTHSAGAATRRYNCRDAREKGRCICEERWFTSGKRQ